MKTHAVVTIHPNNKSVKFQQTPELRLPSSQTIHGSESTAYMKNTEGANSEYPACRGQLTGSLALGDREVQQDVYVVNKLLKPLLGQPAIKALKLLVRIGSVENTVSKNPIQRFLQLFQGLGIMQGEYTIQLKEGAVPFTLATPRRVRIPLMQSVKSELENMGKLGVISRIEEGLDNKEKLAMYKKFGKRVEFKKYLHGVSNAGTRLI